MAVADGFGLPLAIYTESASPHEVKLAERTVTERFTDERPRRIIGDKAYDSDPLDKQLKKLDIELIAPHKANRKKAQTQDGRKLSPLQTTLEDRAFVCVAAKLSTNNRAL